MSKRSPRLNSVNYDRAVKAFGRLGFVVDRQKGSHIVMVRPGHLHILVIPAHKPLAEGTLKSILKAAGITPSEFQALL